MVKRSGNRSGVDPQSLVLRTSSILTLEVKASCCGYLVTPSRTSRGGLAGLQRARTGANPTRSRSVALAPWRWTKRCIEIGSRPVDLALRPGEPPWVLQYSQLASSSCQSGSITEGALPHCQWSYSISLVSAPVSVLSLRVCRLPGGPTIAPDRYADTTTHRRDLPPPPARAVLGPVR